MLPTLVLDLDGTLVDSVPDLAAALNRVLAARGLAGFDQAEVAAMVGDGARVLLERALAVRGAAFDPAPLDAFLADYGANSARESRLYPGVAPTLEHFADAGWRLAVCTNKPQASARALLAALGIADHFTAIGGGDSFPVRKPDPAHLLATLEAAGGTVSRAVMVGDHANDIAAARGADMRVIFAAWGYGPAALAATADAVAGTFAELPALAAGLLEAVSAARLIQCGALDSVRRA